MVKNAKKNKISAVIIYGGDFNGKLLESAKKSVSWCDEIILVNGKKGSFSDWRNEGLKKAKGEWILYLDSDEEITTALRAEVLQTVDSRQPAVFAYAIPRKNIIFGKEFRYSGQYPDYQKRLFKRDSLSKWTGSVHEEPIFDGKISHLKNSIIHHKNMTISQMVDKTNKWSEIEAQLMIDANHPPMNLLRFASVALREFWIKFVKEKAFMDGKIGTIYGIYQVYSKLITYSKLWEMQLK